MRPNLDQFFIHPEEMHGLCADEGPKIPPFLSRPNFYPYMDCTHASRSAFESQSFEHCMFVNFWQKFYTVFDHTKFQVAYFVTETEHPIERFYNPLNLTLIHRFEFKLR